MADQKVLQQRLTRAEKDPRLALDKGWFQEPGFCEGFFDRCEHQAFVLGPNSLELARRAVEMAETHGDPHLIHRGHGVLAHAYLSSTDYFWARKVLDGIRDRALACCRDCRSDYFRRDGDLLGELRQSEDSLRSLNRSLQEGGPRQDPDRIGRTLFVRGIAHHFEGQRRRAIADGGQTLVELSLDSPRGFFLDTLALFAVYIRGGSARDDQAALEHLRTFRRRIRGARDWQDVRTRAAWVAGHLYARLGDLRRAHASFRSAWNQLLLEGLTREIVGATVDLAQLRCHHPALPEHNLDVAKKAIDKCLARRADLGDDHRRGLTEVRGVLKKYPENAFTELQAFRKSFAAPVPGRLGERIGPE